MYTTDLAFISIEAEQKETENQDFLHWLKNQAIKDLDEKVHALNRKISASIDCTQCGNCCQTLVVDIAPEDITACAAHMNMERSDFMEKYIEESQQGRLFINSVPCHFFKDKKCTIYDLRFNDCRDFPHLHKPGFQDRLLGTLLHYGRCPIIYNTIEELKTELNFTP